MQPVSIMIVENNTDLRNTLRHAFEDRGYLTWTCHAPEIAVSIFAAIHPSVVLLDLDFEGARPMELLDAWKEMSPHTRVIVESTTADAHRMREAIDHGARAFLIKPYTLAPLFDLLEQEMPIKKAAA
jgi:two-component system, chemotaxis family, chemotaxis protein CheY